MSTTVSTQAVLGGKYAIERRLAVGGMGALYVARHVLTTRRVALKVLDARLARDEVTIERFLREVRLAAKIGHPDIVEVYDAGIDETPTGERIPYLAMELLTGETMAERYARGDVRGDRALDDILAVTAPMAAAHAQGIVHRDLKPENVFFATTPEGSTRVRLLDLGIAREVGDARKATLAGQALGTVYYMAPEQCIDARGAIPASDVWSLGVMLYQALAGRFPFDGDTAAAVLLRACRDEHVPLATLRPDLDARLTALVERCLSKSPADRPRDATVLRAALTALVTDPVVRASAAARQVEAWTYLPADVAAERPEPPATPAAQVSPPPGAPEPEIVYLSQRTTAPVISGPSLRMRRLAVVVAALCAVASVVAWRTRAPSVPHRAALVAHPSHAAPTALPARVIADSVARTPTPPASVVVAPAAPVPRPRRLRARGALAAVSSQPATTPAPLPTLLPEPPLDTAAPRHDAPTVAQPTAAPREVAAARPAVTQPAPRGMVTAPDFVTF